MKSYMLKIRGGCEMDSLGKKAGKGALVQEELSATLGVSQDQTLFQPNRITVAYSFDSLSSNSMKSNNPNSGCRMVDVAKCLDTTTPDPSKNQGGVAIVQSVSHSVTFEPGVASREGGHIYEGVSGTIRSNPGDNQMSVAYSIENHPNDSRVDIDESGKVQTLTSRCGTGGGQRASRHVQQG